MISIKKNLEMENPHAVCHTEEDIFSFFAYHDIEKVPLKLDFRDVFDFEKYNDELEKTCFHVGDLSTEILAKLYPNVVTKDDDNKYKVDPVRVYDYKNAGVNFWTTLKLNKFNIISSFPGRKVFSKFSFIVRDNIEDLVTDVIINHTIRVVMAIKIKDLNGFYDDESKDSVVDLPIISYAILVPSPYHSNEIQTMLCGYSPNGKNKEYCKEFDKIYNKTWALYNFAFCNFMALQKLYEMELVYLADEIDGCSMYAMDIDKIKKLKSKFIIQKSKNAKLYIRENRNYKKEEK